MSIFLKLASELQTRISSLTEPIIDRNGEKLPALSPTVLAEAFKATETMKSYNPVAIITLEGLNTLNGIHSEFSRKVQCLAEVGMLEEVMNDSSPYSGCATRLCLDQLRVRYQTIHDRLFKGEIDNVTFKKFEHHHLGRDALEIILFPSRAHSELTTFDLLKIMAETPKDQKTKS